jgi:toxin ParE1/3/4
VLEVVLSTSADQDFAEIVLWSEDHFGPRPSLRYQSLILAAFADLAADPDRLGSIDRSKIMPGCRTYHLIHSRRRIPLPRVENPRYFVVFRVQGRRLEVGRLLHDNMNVDEKIATEGFGSFD